ncbi:MAG: hypothetical protein L0387_27010 [Acidobacteria bacterium]|nr:hypothetical protein [Acidobacteriota bacterium]MCI0625251.1 hypothetical protein [Acidobacteriota bacterium]MCI0718794.1 hypothetical protein [Acidobacteriota bacterium]
MRHYGIAVSKPKPIQPDFTAEDRSFIAKLNQENSETFVTVELTSSSDGKSRQVYAGEGEPIYVGSEVRTLVTKIKEQVRRMPWSVP